MNPTQVHPRETCRPMFKYVQCQQKGIHRIRKVINVNNILPHLKHATYLHMNSSLIQLEIEHLEKKKLRN